MTAQVAEVTGEGDGSGEGGGRRLHRTRRVLGGAVGGGEHLKGDAPLIPVALTGVGLYLMWFAVHYFKKTKSDKSLLWPTDPIKSLLTGNPITTASASQAYTTQLDAAITTAAAVSTTAPGGNSGGSPSTGGVAQSGPYQAYAQSLLPLYGWTGQFPALNSLEMREAGWNPSATNPSSGAYGIAQALGHGTGATAGTHNQYGNYGTPDATSKAANNGNGYAQIQWMFNYIKATYGSPNAAWAHEQSAGWY